jgi:type VI secretion system Hcp family effector
MLVSIYVKSSDIPGNVTAKGFENTFEALSLTYGQTRNVGSRAGKIGKADSSLATIEEVVFTKPYDVASTKLFELSFSGKLLTSIVVSLVRQESSGPVTYSEITLEDVVISNYQFNATGGAGHDEPVETVNLNYGKITIKNTPPNADGTAGSPSSAGWNLETNSKI